MGRDAPAHRPTLQWIPVARRAEPPRRNPPEERPPLTDFAVVRLDLLFLERHGRSTLGGKAEEIARLLSHGLVPPALKILDRELKQGELSADDVTTRRPPMPRPRELPVTVSGDVRPARPAAVVCSVGPHVIKRGGT